MIDFKRNKGESFEAFLRRFSRSVIKSRKLKEVRSRQYLQPKLNKQKMKEKTLNTIKLKAKTEYLKKIGKIKEEAKNKW